MLEVNNFCFEATLVRLHFVVECVSMNTEGPGQG